MGRVAGKYLISLDVQGGLALLFLDFAGEGF
jgi:hypothetical protein